MPQSIRLRLFLTCWLVYVAHFATDFAREHYLVLSIVEDHSYVLDKYYGLHPDIFINPPNATVKGAHHGANPGISMVAAIPYFIFRPAVDFVVNRELAARRARNDTTATYQDPRKNRVAFYQKIRKMGWDVRFGLVTAITEVFAMAPITAGSVVLMFSVLVAMGLGQGLSLWLSLVYAFGTPVFLRAGYLNQNLGVGIFSFAAFALIWNPGVLVGWRTGRRLFVAGLFGGLAFLCDYSGAILMGLLGFYAWARSADDRGVVGGFKDSLWYLAGVMPGVLLLWQYQWASFGNAILPPQNWMAPVEFIDVGYKGVGGLSPELLKSLLFDSRFGLFIAMPIAALALLTPFLARKGRGPLPAREVFVCIGMCAVLILFFSTVQYTRIQFATGIRYLAPTFPFLFLAAVPALLRLPRVVTYAVVTVSIVISWSIAMVRSQGTVFENVERVMVEGFQLPWLTVMTKMSAQYLPWFKGTVSVLPIFALCGAMIWLIWRVRTPWRRLDSES
ncbi:MAG: hypothetical protein ABI625_16465 [bacterium]